MPAPACFVFRAVHGASNPSPAGGPANKRIHRSQGLRVAERKEGAAIRSDIRTNDEITAREVRLIDEAGKQLGILPLASALERAQSKALDLVEVAGDAKPPVCRIMDYTKYVYELKRKQKLAKKKGHRQETKELKLRPNIDPHDFGIKLSHARQFLEKGDKVKLTIRYRPREMRHFEIGTKVMNNLIDQTKDLGSVESMNRGGEGIRMQVAILTPKKVPAGVVKEGEE